MEDQILDTLQGIGYNGVPARENKESIKKIIEKVLHIMQINTVTAVRTLSVFALMHQSIPPPQPPLPRATAAWGGGGW